MSKELVGAKAADGADDGFDRGVSDGIVELFAALLDGVFESLWQRGVEDDLDVVTKAFEAAFGTRDPIRDGPVKAL